MGASVDTYASLHTHLHWSCLDGLSKPDELLDKAKAFGLPAVAMTDHGNLHGAVEFYAAARERGVKPIIGAELYIAPRGLASKEGVADRDSFHLTVLAHDLTGYRNLVRLVSIGHLDGMYYKQPRVDLDTLAEYARGLICLSGCCSGQLAKRILAGDLEGATKVALIHRQMFGAGNYYLEVQKHPFDAQRRVNAGLLELAERLNLPIVATTDSHYTEPHEAKAHDVLLCIQVGEELSNPSRFRFEGNDYYLHTPEEMAALFCDMPEAIENTLAIAERCTVELPLGGWVLPAFEPPDGSTPAEHLRTLVYDAMVERYATVTQTLLDRVEYELEVITGKGYEGYMLIVADYVNWAKSQGIAVGPGRGSAAGSVVSYLLNITALDPLFFKLPFERFLTRERPSGPDIDLDFSDKRRDEVLRYVAQKYGSDRVARICTFGTMGARGALRDVGRVLGMPYGQVDGVCKMLPPDRAGSASIETALATSSELRAAYESDPAVTELVDLATSVEGTIRHVSTHACGVVIGDRPLVEHLPLMREIGESGAASLGLLTQFGYQAVERIGLLKMDFLGLINLSIIEETVRLITERRGIEIDVAQIPLDDADTFRLLSSGETTGIFQMESGGIRKWIQELRPASIFDLAALTALYRPGPMNALPLFVERKNDPHALAYLDPRLESILKESYGVVTYQDDVLLIAVEMGGFSWAEADALRKAMGKKIPAEMERQKAKLVSGLVAHGAEWGMTEARALELWQLIEPFAGYGFNKAHAASYAVLAYQTAFLKAHYPVEFMTALLSAQQHNGLKVGLAVAECRRLGIDVLPPDVNHSGLDFSVESTADGRDAIRFGLAAVKNVGRPAAQSIRQARAQQPYVSVEDFSRRVDLGTVSRQAVEALIKCGALDGLGGRRLAMLDALDRMLATARADQRAVAAGQTAMFDLGVAIQGNGHSPEAGQALDDTPLDQRLKWEREHLGLYLGPHPLMAHAAELEALQPVEVSDIVPERAGEMVTLAGLVSGQRKITTRQEKAMLAVMLEDLTGDIEVIVFPKVLEATADFWQDDALVVVEGHVDYREDVPQLLCERVRWLEDSVSDMEASSPDGVADDLGWSARHIWLDVPETDDLPADEDRLRQALEALWRYPGRDEVSLRFASGATIERHPAARTRWNPRLEAELIELLGPGRVHAPVLMADVDVGADAALAG